MPTKILAIDDSKTMRLAIKITFAAEDVDVTSVGKGSDAVARAKQLGANLVLVDHALGDGEPSGYDVCQSLKNDGETSAIPVIVMVSNQSGVDQAKLKAAGGDGWIAKPFDTTELLDKVGEVLGKPVAKPTATGKPAAKAAPKPAAKPAAAKPAPAPRPSPSRPPISKPKVAAAAPKPAPRPAPARPAVKPVASTPRPAAAAAAPGQANIPIAIPIPFTSADSPTPGDPQAPSGRRRRWRSGRRPRPEGRRSAAGLEQRSPRGRSSGKSSPTWPKRFSSAKPLPAPARTRAGRDAPKDGATSSRGRSFSFARCARDPGGAAIVDRLVGELVRIDLDILPRDPVFRPIGRQAWYARKIPAAVGIGLVVGLLGAAVDPLMVVASATAVVGWSLVRRRRMYRLLRDNDDGLALIAGGEVEAAASLFDGLCARSRRMPALHSLLVHNRAVAHLEAGQPDRAYALLCAVAHAGWVGPRGALSVYHCGLLGRLAMAQALRGEVEEAERWRSRAHAASSEAKRGALLLTDCLVEARAQQWERLIELVEQRWAQAENLNTARTMRAVRMLEAFALEHAQADLYRAESRETDRTRALAAAKSGPAGQFDHLATQWPELRGFLDRQDL